jgi:hypothetical protein
MTEEEQWQYNLLDEENKKKMDLVLEELKPYMDKQEFSILTELDNDIVKEFLEDNKVPLYSDFRDKIKTPFAIMRYLSLFDEQESLTKKLDEYLKANKSDEFEYFILKQFKNEIVFRVKNKGELKVRYIYNPEEELFNFYLVGNTSNFPISFVNIELLPIKLGSFNKTLDKIRSKIIIYIKHKVIIIIDKI